MLRFPSFADLASNRHAMKRSLTSIIAFLLLALPLGCQEPEQAAPPVLDVLSEMEDADIARRAEEESKRQQALEAIKSAGGGKPEVPIEGVYVVEFETTAGNFSIEVHRDWAPYGADRFYKLVKDGFYNEAMFFRVMKGFMVQWGIAARPGMNLKWDVPIPDDPVVRSNKRGYVSFAQQQSPHSRTGQVFINYVDNKNLDTMDQGFAPFGKVIDGMEAVDAINGKHGQTPDQSRIRSRGNAYLKEHYPDLDYIKSAKILIDDLPEVESDSSESETDPNPLEDPDDPTDEDADQ